ncbi:MAG: 30S ribosomal protein S3 [Candidatus Pacebacteria bacterium]|nr:30S ribosomal protein S3 [Candidatus Paceibacterota bacterium]
MGQKVNPTGFRIGNTFTWKSRWFAKKDDYQGVILEDVKIRKYLNEKLAHAGVVGIDIERSITTLKLILFVSRPGVVIGKGGENLRKVQADLNRTINAHRDNGKKLKINLKVEEVRTPDLSAKLVAERIKDQIEKRYPHRRAVSQALEKVMAAGGKGVKIQLSGRIGGAEIGRTEKYFEGSVPTQTLRANIDYFQGPALTKSGYVGIKVWIYKGMVDGK